MVEQWSITDGISAVGPNERIRSDTPTRLDAAIANTHECTEVLELGSTQWLCERVGDVLVGRYVLNRYTASLYEVSDEVVG